MAPVLLTGPGSIAPAAFTPPALPAAAPVAPANAPLAALTVPGVPGAAPAATPNVPIDGFPRPSLPGVSSAAPATLPAEVTESLIHFEPTSIEVRKERQHWQLWTGRTMLKDFGDKREQAWEARKLIVNMGLTERGSVGTPEPVMEYWLSHGQSPPLTNVNYNMIPFDAPSLRVDAVKGEYWLRDDNKQLFNFGMHASDAHKALTIMKKYEFNEIGFVGVPDPAMTYLIHDPRSPSLASTSGAKPANHDFRFQTLPQQSKSAALVLPKIGTVGSRMPFDPMRLDLHKSGDGWHLVSGNRDLGSAGGDELTARSVMHIAQRYPLNEYCRIGTSDFGFYLSHNQAPRGLPLGVNHISFDPQALKVQQTGDQWHLVNGQQTIAEGTGSVSEAKLALQVIQYYQFNARCDAGNFHYLARDR